MIPMFVGHSFKRDCSSFWVQYDSQEGWYNLNFWTLLIILYLYLKDVGPILLIMMPNSWIDFMCICIFSPNKLLSWMQDL